MIEAINIVKDFGSIRALKRISFRIDYGEFVGIVGRSGCGKTTLAKIICRLLEPTEGEVLYRGESIFRLKRQKLKGFRQKVQIVFQDPYASLDPKMTIEKILLEPLIIHNNVIKKYRMQRIRELLKKVGLRYDLMNKYPHQLSGGERQRINIARALAVEPKLLICDEPVSSLDLVMQAQILRLLAKLRRENNLALLFISHDPYVIKAVADRVINI